MEAVKDKKAKVVDLIKGAAKPRKPRTKAQAPVSQITITNSGSGDGVGIGNTIIKIKTEQVTHKTIATPRPGEEHITEEQVSRLHLLVDEIVRLEAIAKRDPAGHQRVWKSLNAKMHVGAMRMIRLEKFKAAEAYLLKWLAQLTARPTTAKKAPETVEKRRITYIQTNMKKLGVEDRVRDYMERNWGTRSLKGLPNLNALEKVYHYVAGLKRSIP